MAAILHVVTHMQTLYCLLVYIIPHPALSHPRFTIMEKILTLVAVLVVLMAMAEAGKQQQCREQIESQEQQLSHCEKYLSQKGKNFELAEEEEKQPPQECCRALQSFNRECRCAAVREAFGRQLEKDLEESGGWVEERKMQRALQKAKFLPRSCNMQQAQECQIRPPMVI